MTKAGSLIRHIQAFAALTAEDQEMVIRGARELVGSTAGSVAGGKKRGRRKGNKPGPKPGSKRTGAKPGPKPKAQKTAPEAEAVAPSKQEQRKALLARVKGKAAKPAKEVAAEQ